MADDDKANQTNGQGKGKKNNTTYRPMSTTITALGVGAAWAALHMPTIHGLSPSLVTWLIHAVIAALAAKATLDLVTATLSWCIRAVTGLF